jgi:hypothetical protein
MRDTGLAKALTISVLHVQEKRQAMLKFLEGELPSVVESLAVAGRTLGLQRREFEEKVRDLFETEEWKGPLM